MTTDTVMGGLLMADVNMQKTELSVEKMPMHPDDFRALHAWVTAKRLHEDIIRAAHSETTLCPRFSVYR